MSTPSYITFRGRVYHFRVNVPRPLQELFRRKEYKRSLSTGDYKTACRISMKYGLFVQQYFDLIKIMMPDNDLIKFLIRNHFEKCLIDAEDHIWGARNAREYEPDNEEYIDAIIERLEERLTDLQTLARHHEYGTWQEDIANQLYEWKSVTVQPFDDLYKELCRGVMDAHIEATRLHIAYFKRDGEGMNIRPEIFKGCHDFIRHPDYKHAEKFIGKPYHGEQVVAAYTLREAVENYFLAKRRETPAWRQAHRPYLERTIDILGGERLVKELTRKDGTILEDRIWDIPANYKRDHSDTSLASFFDGDQGEYDKLSPPTVKQYFIGIKGFFTWCEDQEYLPKSIMTRVKLNKAKSGAHKSDQRAYNPEELKLLFSSPLYTGHKYLGRQYWVPGDIIERKGYFWVPLVGLFSGLRESELLYLQVSDIREEEGVSYINVDDENDKSLKTSQSKRTIPIHPVLKRIGFLEYVAGRKSKATSQNERLFDGITFPDGGKVIKNFSRNYSNLIKEIGIKVDKRLNFHSLRHNYVSAMTRVPGITVEIMDPLDGRDTTGELRGTRKGYVTDYTPAELYQWIEKMDLKVDLSHLYPPEK